MKRKIKSNRWCRVIFSCSWEPFLPFTKTTNEQNVLNIFLLFCKIAFWKLDQCNHESKCWHMNTNYNFFKATKHIRTNCSSFENDCNRSICPSIRFWLLLVFMRWRLNGWMLISCVEMYGSINLDTNIFHFQGWFDCFATTNQTENVAFRWKATQKNRDDKM